MIVLAGRIALVEIPRISPILADHISVPRPHRLILGAALVLLLVTAAARRWSEPSPAGSATGSEPWRRDESRYYRERPFLVVLVAAVALAPWPREVLDFSDWEWMRCVAASLIMMPEGCLSLALMLLAVQSVFSKRPNDAGATSIAPSRLAPGLFLLNWSMLLAIVLFAAPILGAWGFALCLNLR
jgi:hypothetical protein